MGERGDFSRPTPPPNFKSLQISLGEEEDVSMATAL